MRDNNVQAVSRALELLGVIAKHPQGIGITRLSRETELHKSTVSRLVATLETAGAIQRTQNRADVQIAPLFAEQFLPQTVPDTLLQIARPFLEELSIRTNEAAALAIPDGYHAVYINQISPDTTIQVKDWTGYRFPQHTVSAGKLFLAYSTTAEQEDYFQKPLATYTANTVTDPDQLRASFAEITQTGISWIFDEFADGLSGVAAPLFGQQNKIVGALSIYGPSYRFPDKDKIDQLNQRLTHCAQQCSAQFQAIQQKNK